MKVLLYKFSFSLWQGMVGFNLKDVVDKNSRAEKKMRIVQNFLFRKSSLMASVHLVLCSWGPFRRIISRNVEMRFGLKYDFLIN